MQQLTGTLISNRKYSKKKKKQTTTTKEGREKNRANLSLHLALKNTLYEALRISDEHEKTAILPIDSFGSCIKSGIASRPSD